MLFRVRISLILLCVALVGLLDHFGILASLDRVISDQHLRWNNTAPSGDIVMVEIDSQSLKAVDTWPWARSVHARLLDKLMNMGANEVAFDVDFSSYSTEAEDQVFAKSLENAGGYAYLAAFEQISGTSGKIERATPVPEFAAAANPVLVNVVLDRWGLARSFPTRAIGNPSDIPALAAVFGEPKHSLPPSMLFDFSIDLDRVGRISYASVLDGAVDPARIAGKKVIVGASAVELRDLFTVPRYGVIPGPLLQVAAAETVKAGRVLVSWGAWPSLAFAFAAALLMHLLMRRKLVLAGIFTLGCMAAWEAFAYILFARTGIIIQTGAAHIAMPLLFFLAIFGQAANWWRQRLAMQRRLEYLARFDEVSGAHTRMGFTEMLDGMLPGQSGLSVLLVRIERLDIVRGALGQDVARQTLRAINERLQTIAPGRVGLVAEDVFAISCVTPNPVRDLGRYREQISFRLAEPFTIGEHTVILDSCLAACSATEPETDAETLISRAEITLARPEAWEPGEVHFYAPLFAREVSDRRRLDVDMREGLLRNEFRLVFQPQIDLKTGKLVGAEALIRWQHPERGPVPPGSFIGLAEETGFIVELGDWVIGECCAIIAPWNWIGSVAVNVSAVQLELSDVRGTVKRALKQTGLGASQLEIEITESVLVGEKQRVVATMNSIRQLGVPIAIDDFGTGYSSLSYLTQLPFDKLKIDRSFIGDITRDPDDLAIVEAIAVLARRLGKKIVVEGIETAEQDRLLRTTSCDIGQGYFYSRPVEAHALGAHIMKFTKKTG